MNGIFLCVCLLCSVLALVTGRAEQLGAELMSAGEAAVTLGLTLAGAYMIWCGLLKILDRAGAAGALAKRLHPLVRWLLGREGDDPAVARAVSLNLTANLLGMGNAATPAGLEAMRLMARAAPEGRATDGMCLFLVLNASSLQLVPTTVLSLRAACGAADPAFVVLPALVGSVSATVCAVLLGKICVRLGKKCSPSSLRR